MEYALKKAGHFPESKNTNVKPVKSTRFVGYVAPQLFIILRPSKKNNARLHSLAFLLLHIKILFNQTGNTLL
jgi:hypothetical protein